MELYCHRCGMHTHIVRPGTYNVRCWICGNALRSDPRHDRPAAIHFPINDQIAKWFATAEEKVSTFLAKTYANLEEFFSDEPPWSEPDEEFVNNPNNSPPEARARFPRWK